nr:hypothetical protein [Tanacetum cinerariifolium]
MVAILEKSEHNVDFPLIVNFVEASQLRYALTFKPTVYVSHIRQFWSTARIETTEEGTQILASVDGILRTVSESSIRRNLKLKDEAGISSLPDAELFENLTLMGYNISPNQKFTFQKGFNEFSSNITTALVCLATNRTYNFSKMIFDGLVKNVNNKVLKFLMYPRIVSLFDIMLIQQGEGSRIPTKPITHPPKRQYTRRARIAQSSALPSIADEPASPMRDVSQGEACPTDSGFLAYQDRATIAKSSTLPYDSTPRVTSPATKEGTQEVEINRLKERVKILKDKEGVIRDRYGDDAPIKGRRIDEEEVTNERVSSVTKEVRLDEGEVAAERAIDVPIGSGSIPTASTLAEGLVPTGSEEVPTANPVFATATVVARELEEQLAREDQRRTEQIARDAEIARIYAEEELQSMIDGLDSNNETVAKYLKEYQQFSSELPMERRIELITKLVKYQDNYTKDMANIAKTFTLPHESTSKVTSFAADEGRMQKKLNELTALCTSLQRQQSEMVSKFEAQELEINSLKARIKLLEDKDRGVADQSGDDAPIKGRRLDEGEEAAERVSDDTEEMATILTSMDAASILTSGGVQMVPTAAEVATATVSIPTGSGVVSTISLTIPTAAPIFTTATETTPYTRRKGKETMVKFDTPKKKKVQEQIDVQLARELEEEMIRDSQRMNEQITQDAKIARIHAEEELQMLIDGLDRNNETVAKYLQEYDQFAVELPFERRIELISDLVKYQDNYAKAKHFKGMTLEEIKEKFDPVWKQIQDFIPLGSKEEAERFKRKGLRLEQESAKKLKTSEEVHEEVKSSEEVSEEKVKEMMQLVPVEEIYVEALQHLDREDLNQLWRLVKESLNIRPAASDKEMELWVPALEHKNEVKVKCIDLIGILLSGGHTFYIETYRMPKDVYIDDITDAAGSFVFPIIIVVTGITKQWWHILNISFDLEDCEDKVYGFIIVIGKEEAFAASAAQAVQEEKEVMAISIISVFSDSSEVSVRTSTGRVILFGTIPTTIPNTTLSMIPPSTHVDTTLIHIVSPTIPPSLDYTPASPDYTPASLDSSPASDTKSDLSKDPSLDHIPPLPDTSQFLSSTNDSSDNDILDIPPSPTHVMVLAPGQPIPHGRLYRYHLNGPVHMMTTRKRVGPLPTHRLAMRHSVDYSSSYHFSSDDSSRDSSSSSSSKTSLDSSADVLSDSASSRSTLDHSLPAPSSDMRPTHHLCSLVPSIHRSSVAIFARQSKDSSSTSPSHKRSRSPDASVPLSLPIPRALSYAHRGIYARVVVKAVDRDKVKTRTRGLVEIRVDRVTHPVTADDIPELAQEEGAVEVTYETLGDLVQRFHDHTIEIPVHRVQANKGIQRDQGHRIMETRQQITDMLERIRKLVRDNMRLRDMMDAASLCREAFGLPFLETMPNTRFGASRTREEFNEQIDRRLAGALGARDTTRNLEPLIGNGGNRNCNGNEGGNGYNFEGFMPARECIYQDFLKCQPLSFNGTEGVVGLTRWFENLETLFHISNCPEKYQVKYATCTLLNSALTWWNSHKRTIGIEATYAMSWAELMKMITEVYCPRNEVQKMETEMVPNEEEKVKRFVGGLPEIIQGNVIAAEPTKLQDAIHITNNLMDQKLKGYARSADNKRRLENNPSDNRGQQPIFKRQNVGGQNVARAYTARNNEKKSWNQPSIVCYECGRPRHFRKDCAKLRNLNRENQTGKKNGNKTGIQTSGNEATARAYAIGRGGANAIPTLSRVRSFSITVMLLCYSIRASIRVLCRLPLVFCLMLHHPL